MSLDNVVTPSFKLTGVTEIWGHILFWAFLLSMIIYVATGIILAVVVPVLSKKMRLLIPFIYLIYGLLRLVFVEAVASAVVAGVYVTSGWGMTTGVAVAWGLGLSLGTNLLSLLISWVPLYSFL